MSVAPPATTVTVHVRDVKAEVDELFHTYFTANQRLALLACDRVGVTPDELLYRSRNHWHDALKAATKVRPVAKSFDLNLTTSLKNNMQERARQVVFRQLLDVRRDMATRGKVDELWQHRLELLEATGDEAKLTDAPLAEVEPAALPEVKATPPLPSLSHSAADSAMTPGTRRSRHSRRPSVAPPPRPSTPSEFFCRMPAEAPLCKNRTMDNLDREEVLLLDALRDLSAYAKKQVIAERQAAAMWDSRRAAAQSVLSPDLDMSLERTPLTARPPRLASLSDNLRPRDPIDGSVTSRRTVTGSDKEMAALVRNTMGYITSSVINDQKFTTILTEQTQSADTFKLHQTQASLRRRAASPSTYSVPGNKQYVAPRPPTDGLPSDRVRQVRADRKREEERRRAEWLDQRDRRRTEQAERAKASAANKFAVSAQAGNVRQDIILQNRERADRAALAKRMAVVEDREKKRYRAAQVNDARREQAHENRLRHYQVQDLRRKFRDHVETMSIRGQWDVPDELRGLMQDVTSHMHVTSSENDSG